jgi:hypothetical protein
MGGEYRLAVAAGAVPGSWDWAWQLYIRDVKSGREGRVVSIADAKWLNCVNLCVYINLVHFVNKVYDVFTMSCGI